MRKRKILQIMPASEWNVIFRTNGVDRFEPVVCFGLIGEIYTSTEQILDNHVVPMVQDSEQGICFADELPDYAGVMRRE